MVIFSEGHYKMISSYFTSVKERKGPPDLPPATSTSEQADMESTPSSPSDSMSIDSSGPTATTSTTSADTSGIPSIEELIQTKRQWLKSANPTRTLSRSQQASLTREFDNQWLKVFPWLQPIIDEKKVISVMCSICRGGDMSQLGTSVSHSGGVWMSIPFTKFGKLTRKARKHEFGMSKDFKTVNDPKKTCSDIVKGTQAMPDTVHMKLFINSTREKSAIEISLVMGQTNNVKTLQLNKEAMLMLIAIVHRSVMLHQSPFSSVKDTVLFDIKQLECTKLQRLVDQDSGISMRRIGEIVDCIDRVVTLGIYKEMVESFRTPEELIVFSGLIDNGSKVKKTKEYAGVGVKFATQDGAMTRVLNFTRCSRKDGASLCEVLLQSYSTFNNKV